MSVMVELLLPCLHVPYIATIPNVQLLAVREFHFVPTTNDELFRLSLFEGRGQGNSNSLEQVIQPINTAWKSHCRELEQDRLVLRVNYGMVCTYIRRLVEIFMKGLAEPEDLW